VRQQTAQHRAKLLLPQEMTPHHHAGVSSQTLIGERNPDGRATIVAVNLQEESTSAMPKEERIVNRFFWVEFEHSIPLKNPRFCKSSMAPVSSETTTPPHPFPRKVQCQRDDGFQGADANPAAGSAGKYKPHRQFYNSITLEDDSSVVNGVIGEKVGFQHFRSRFVIGDPALAGSWHLHRPK